MIDFEKLRERKTAEADALGAVDIRNVRPSARDFAYYVASDRKEVGVCVELFRRDPYGSAIPEPLDYAALVREAEEVGALAIGVATDAELHGGSELDLALVGAAAAVPVLRIDYLVRENQLFRSRLLGADSAILHASLLDERALAKLLEVGRHMRMECVVEAVDRDGIDRAIGAGARIVSVDARAPGADRAELLAHAPAGAILVARGGVETAADLRSLRGKADAALVGAPFLSAPDPIEFLSALIES